MEETKTCKDCGETKPVTDFYQHGEWYGSYCKLCTKKRGIEFRQTHKQACKRDPVKKLQPGACNICGVSISKGIGTLCHEHRTKVQNDLSPCTKCRWALYCRERIKVGLWVLCERPDRADLERVKLFGILEIDYRPIAVSIKELHEVKVP